MTPLNWENIGRSSNLSSEIGRQSNRVSNNAEVGSISWFQNDYHGGIHPNTCRMRTLGYYVSKHPKTYQVPGFEDICLISCRRVAGQHLFACRYHRFERAVFHLYSNTHTKKTEHS